MTPTQTTDHDVVARAADRLRTAQTNVQPTQPVRDLLGSTDIELAYRVQALQTRNRIAAGAHVIGHKIGLTSPAVRQQLGVDQPDFGSLFDDMLVPNGGTVDRSRLIQPKAEAEVAFVLGADLDGFGNGEPADAAGDDRLSDHERRRLVDSVAYAVAALEIVDSRVDNWDITITDTVADNASSACFVLSDVQVPLTEFVPADVTMTLLKNGEPASEGNGAACMGDPLVALAWLARTLARHGNPLKSGDLVLSGALGPMVTAEAGTEIVADLSVLGRVSARFSE